MTIVKTLKALYERLGGTPSDVANATRAVEVLNAIAALYDGTDDATRITKAIANIVAVASGLIKPSGTKSITANGSGIDVTEYAAVDVNVPQPSGTISITANGTGIDVANYVTADVNVPNDNTDLMDLISRHLSGTFTVPNGDNAIQIGNYAFYDCAGLANVDFEYVPYGGNNSIGHHAFANCINLTSLNLMGFIRVEWDAFTNSGITTLYFSTELQEFLSSGSGQTVFGGATALTDIYYTGTQQQWEAITGLSSAGIPQDCTIHYEYTPS